MPNEDALKTFENGNFDPILHSNLGFLDHLFAEDPVEILEKNELAIARRRYEANKLVDTFFDCWWRPVVLGILTEEKMLNPTYDDFMAVVSAKIAHPVRDEEKQHNKVLEFACMAIYTKLFFVSVEEGE